MTFAPKPFYTTSAEPEEAFQEVRRTLALHPELLGASPEQVTNFLSLKPATFEIEAMLEALRLDSGDVAA